MVKTVFLAVPDQCSCVYRWALWSSAPTATRRWRHLCHPQWGSVGWNMDRSESNVVTDW